MHRKKVPYYTIYNGYHFGLEDIYIRVNQVQIQLAKKKMDTARSKKKLKQYKKTDKRSEFPDSDSSLSSSSYGSEGYDDDETRAYK